MLFRISLLVFCFCQLCGPAMAQPASDPADNESRFLSNVRQLTFEGKRSGEGYFSADGSAMVFQSERDAANPFYQIYLLDMETGDTNKVSPGNGKTTCAWIHPDNDRVLFASTHEDPDSVRKQQEELQLRLTGQQRRYSWDYDPSYELFAWNRGDQTYQQLTNAEGYDAEGSYSPDGQWIAFASNRNAYAQPMDAEQKKAFEIDPATMMEIYIARADGSDVRQLTETPGYDGGPFFSPDGKRICWRRFSMDGVTAEIMTMNVDGTDQKTITRMSVMSWAPFYHPSGDYLIFTTNQHGFGNFELYAVRADGKSPPVRVTTTDDFDGLASFTPDGKQLTWTSKRNPQKQSQIYLADWDDASARVALGLEQRPRLDSRPTEPDTEVNARTAGLESIEASVDGFEGVDIMRHVDFLCRRELAGRMTGSRGEQMATQYVATWFEQLGLKPAGDDATYLQAFDFPDGAKLGAANTLTQSIGEKSESFAVDSDWRPLVFSANESIKDLDVVFAGYGIVAPEKDTFAAYNSYEGIEVKDKWVVVFRFVPEDVTPEQRQHLQFYAGLRKKLFYARNAGAKGLIVVSGPNSNVRNQLVPMVNDFSPSGSSMLALSVTDAVAERWFEQAGKSLVEVQTKLDGGSVEPGFGLTGVKLSANVELEKVTGHGQNVLGRLQAGDTPSEKVVVVGAHIDHLGTGKTGGSLARNDESEKIHFGADDNASGVAAMLEIAQYLSAAKRSGKLSLKHDVIFAGWSGEELGLHGSHHFVESFPGSRTTTVAAEDRPASPHDFTILVGESGSLKLNGTETTMDEIMKDVAFIVETDPAFPISIESTPNVATQSVTEVIDALTERGLTSLTVSVINKDQHASEQTIPDRHAKIIAALNMDMVGRMEENLILQGIGSSDAWAGMIESKNAVVGLPLTLSDDTQLPTDASSFYQVGVPILAAFTGSHSDYHTPRDTPEKLNYPDAARIAKLMGLITRQLAVSDKGPEFIFQTTKPKMSAGLGQRAYLGTVPDYGTDVVGVKLNDATPGAPAHDAGVRGGDILVELAGQKIENIYDYTAILDGVKIGDATTIVVVRNGERMTLEITPGSRQ